MTTKAHHRRNQHGAAIVELALVFLLFLVVVIGMLEFGRAMWTYATITHASRQAARYAMVKGEAVGAVTQAQITTKVKDFVTGLDTSQITVNTTFNPDPIERGGFIEIEVSYPFRLMTSPIIVAQGTIPMSSSTRFMVAN